MKKVLISFLGATLLAKFGFATLINASFEDPSVGLGDFTTGGIAGWSSDGGAGCWHIPLGPYFDAPAPDGLQIAYINGSSIAQQATDQISIGTNRLTVMAGRRGDDYCASFTVEMWAGGSVANGSVVAGTLLASTAFDVHTIEPNSFTQIEVDYNAGESDPILGQLISVRIVRTAGPQADLDDVRIGSAVPEPNCLAALGVGIILLRRQRRKNWRTGT